MRLILLEEYDERTMELARPIYDRRRRVLLAAGRKIHPKYVERLKQMDIRYVFVEDAASEGITLEELLDMPSWIDAIDVVEEAFDAVRKREELPLRSLFKLAVKLVDEVKKRKVLAVIPATSIAMEVQPYAHAVNVALLSLQLGKKMNCNDLQLRDLALGALLHDVGKALEGEEHHTVKGFEYLRKERELSLLCAHVAYQHHEHVNGSGTPRGLTETSIHLYAQICAIADEYENLISVEFVPPHEALEIVMARSGIRYSQQLVRLFVETIPAYLPGTMVKMSDGRNAIVTKIIEHMQRPYVRYIDTHEEIALADHPSLLIVGQAL
ncbi:HD-GYP domain-containing protein [Anoxybacillus sp.]|uniref:HD-GYP domain-containing protein n=1 Tax=Anoxybacillus sp. TaxID=1872573 RepID=UPI00262F5BCA|nr:HD domain-containing phosphohydrolase [uncultured Anoxybacillus sp.]